MDVKDKILDFMKVHGPVIPAQISKVIDTDILFASAHLSELTDHKKVKISNLKVGGSPLYYLPGQEAQLQRFSDNLAGKEKQAYQLLMQHKVLRDKELEPSIRVALRMTKDFAAPLEVTSNNQQEIFWRWYLTVQEEADALIKERLKAREEAKMPEEKVGEKAPLPIRPTGLIKEPRKKEKIDSEAFLNKVLAYLKEHRIQTIQQEIVKKQSELNYIIQLQTALGQATYFCKAKNKKKINEDELRSLFIEAQSRKLPALLLTSGELTKKAKELLEKDFKGLLVRRV